MALRLVRQTSSTPNITNKDDTVMTRFAYGGYNGVVKNFGNECDYHSFSGFKILDGRIVIDGWEIDILGDGITITNTQGTVFRSIYAEINLATETAEIKSVYLQGHYPEIEKGDDLTKSPYGTAKLLLYNVKFSGSEVVEVIKRFSVIEHLSDKIKRIDERLDSLGFKSGVAGFSALEGVDIPVVTTSVNSLIKQGNFCIFNLEAEAFFPSLQIDIPKEFKPENEIEFYAFFTGQDFSGQKVENFSLLKIDSNGKISFQEIGFFYSRIQIKNVGWKILNEL